MQKHFSVPPLLKEISSYFRNAGFSVYLVGGAVRDSLLHKPASDWDIATDATPLEVMRLFKKTIPTGIEHGTVTVIYKKKHIECTTFRAEAGYADGRHPDSISYAATIEDRCILCKMQSLQGAGRTKGGQQAIRGRSAALMAKWQGRPPRGRGRLWGLPALPPGLQAGMSCPAP